MRFVSVRLMAWLLLVLAWGASPAVAADPSPSMKVRASQLIELFNGADHADMFTPTFLSQVPVAQLQTISTQLVSQFGKARTIDHIDSVSDTYATVFVDFEKAVVRAEVTIEPGVPHRVTGLVVTATDMKNDSLATIMREVWGLPGESSMAVAKLEGSTPPAFSVTYKADKPLAVGSAFKLFLLAELSRSIRAGERKWSDVVALDQRSIQSGVLQTWPAGSPLTLHTLAAMMISQSDNTAADVLLHLLGREKVERLLPTIGVRAPERLRPLLSTREAALLKAGPDAETLRARWIKADAADRRAILAGPLAKQPPESVDVRKLMGQPVAIDSVEWFVSTADLVHVLDWLRVNGDKQTLDILAINSGLPRTLAADFSYVGYKGGSESGVMNMTLLLRSKSGVWHALSGTWNNPAAELDETRFQLLISRAVSLLK